MRLQRWIYIFTSIFQKQRLLFHEFKGTTLTLAGAMCSFSFGNRNNRNVRDFLPTKAINKKNTPSEYFPFCLQKNVSHISMYMHATTQKMATRMVQNINFTYVNFEYFYTKAASE